jgi:hypothetical protein
MTNYEKHYYSKLTVNAVKKASDQYFRASIYWQTKNKEKSNEYLLASKELDDLIK